MPEIINGISFPLTPKWPEATLPHAAPPPSAENLDRAIASTCTMMKQYNIPWTQIFGHYQVDGMEEIKDDPGEEFLQEVFIPRVKQQCGSIGGIMNDNR